MLDNNPKGPDGGAPSIPLPENTKLDLINEAPVVLISKTSDAAAVTDFRPISLINSLAKIITKVLADRLAPRLSELVSV
jgi:hypothetical protein